jgi:hypothetical protein
MLYNVFLKKVGELRAYLKSNGAALDDEGPEDLSENLSEIFFVCRESMKSCSEIGL